MEMNRAITLKELFNFCKEYDNDVNDKEKEDGLFLYNFILCKLSEIDKSWKK
jgi:hypothetical protein